MRFSRVGLVGAAAAVVLTACPSTSGPPKPGEVAVSSFQPKGATQTQPIEVRFSESVVGAEEIGKPFTQPALLEIRPPIPGRYVWNARDTLGFTPSEPFHPTTRYKVTVRLDALPLAQNQRPVGAREFEFNTPLLQVEGVEPYFEGIETVTVRANVRFSHPVKPEAAQTAVWFTDATERRLGATLETTSPANVMAFRLEPLGAGARTGAIKVHVLGNLTAASGGEPLGKEQVKELVATPPEPLVVESIQPLSNYGGGSDEAALEVRFNTPIDAESAQKAVSVEPGGEVRLTATYRGVYVAGKFTPGASYNITVKKGLVGQRGGRLEADVVRVVTIPDLAPQVRFQSEGSYLMKRGRQSFAIESRNTPKLDVVVEKVLENNLIHVLPRLRARSIRCAGDSCYGEGESEGADFDGEGGYEYEGGNFGGSVRTFGSTLFTGTVDVPGKKNEWATTAIPFKEIDADARRGLYRLRVSDRERSWTYAEKWLLATDLGLVAKVGRDQARVQVVSLETLKPIAGVELSFISRTNQVLGTARTGADGIAVQSLKAALPGEPLSLITARSAGDFSYLTLAGTAIATADFDVGGDGDTSAPYAAYLYADRGIYRPGDKAFLTVLVRDKELKTPPPFPYSMEIRDPQGRLFKTLRGSTEEDGARVQAIEIPDDALTGGYTALVRAPGSEVVLGRLSLKVEDFMPDRIKVEVKAEKPSGEIDAPAEFKVDSAYLFGPKASGLRLEGRCAFSEVGVKVQAGLTGFEMAGDPAWADEPRHAIHSDVALGESALDEEGQAAASCAFEGGEPPRRPLEVSYFATVSENGGRAVTGSGSALMHAHPHYLGVRRAGKSSYAEAKKDAELEVIAVDREGAPKAGVKVKASFFAIEWKTILKMVNNRYQYVSEKKITPISEREITTKKDPVTLPFVPEAPGSYRVDLEAGPSGSKASFSFWAAGGGQVAWEMNKPDQVGLMLDKDRYAPGETAKVMVRAPFEGRLFVTVEREKVIWSDSVELSGNAATLNIPISELMTPNAYIVAELLRSPRSVEKAAPLRAVGVIPLSVSAEKHRLQVALEAPESMRPKHPLEVEVVVKGASLPARVTVAAVDEGILRITDHRSPDAFAFFTKKRRLSVSTHDFFEQLLPEVLGKTASIVRGNVHAGGGDEALRKKHLGSLSVRRVKPVALFSGIVKLDAQGRAKIRFEVPELAGSLRLMAVAFSGDKFGSASRNVTVRDPITLTPTLPRFVGPLDKFQVPVDVHNGTKTAQKVEVEIGVEGRIKPVGAAKQTIALEPNKQGTLRFELAADEVVGKAKVTIRAGSGENETRSETELAIRPASTVVTEGDARVLSAAAPVELKIGGGFLPGTMKARLTVGPSPVAQFGASLQYLLEYPYGCVEQTTSRAFPLLYLKDLAAQSAPELLKDNSADAYVNAGIGRLLGMLNAGGGFSYWPGAAFGYPWSSIYATHFLVEAKKAGYEVDAPALARLLDHLGQIANGAALPVYQSRPADFRSQVYALYVLALARRPNVSALLFAADQLALIAKGDKAHSPAPGVYADDEIRTLIGGALLLVGQKGRVSEFIGTELTLGKPAASRSDSFWSSTRADALMLAVLAEVAPDHKSVPVLMKNLIGRAQIGRWSNTQENAYALMALGKIGHRLGNGSFSGVVKLDGAPIGEFDDQRAFHASGGEAWANKKLTLSLSGAGSAFVGLEVEGIKAGLLPDQAKGIDVRRVFLDRDGKPIEPAQIRQGDLIITRIQLSIPGGERIDNVAVADLLPAGLEIENPRLSADAAAGWMADKALPSYLDVRDDRILFFANLEPGAPQTYYYASRAVTAGEFVLPPVHAEAMYDPAVQAHSGGGRLVVKGR